MSDKNENRSSATSDECAVKCVSSKKSRKGNSKKRKANSGQKMQKANCDTIKDQFYRSVAPKDMKSKQKVTKKCDDECGSSSKRFNSDDETSGASEECESREVCEDLRQTPDAHTGFKSNKCDDSNNSAQKKKFKDEMTGEWLCPVCHTTLDSQHSFTVHIRQHNPTDHSHTCSICGKTLSSASSLDRHMLIHSGERPFKCRICNMAFTTNGNMHRHMRTHGVELNDHDSHDNNNNNNKFKAKKRKSNEDSVQKETKLGSQSSPKNRRQSEGDVVVSGNIVSEQFVCQVCNKFFVSRSALHSHMEQHPNDSLTCRDCGALLENFETFTQHHCFSNLYNSANKCALTPPPAIGFYDLTFTDFSSSKFSLIAKSYCEHNVRKSSSSYHDFECSKCEKAFPCGSALNLHQTGHSEETYCHICRCDLGTPAQCMSHKLKHRIDSSLLPNGVSSSHEVHKSAFSDLTPSDKEGFLALLQLQNKNLNSCSPSSSQRSEDYFDNAAYYIHAKPLPTKPIAFKPKIVNGGGSETEHGKHDLADIQSIISVTSTATPLITRIRSSPPAGSPASPVESRGQTKPDSPIAADAANESATVLVSIGEQSTEDKTEEESERKENGEEDERKENDNSEVDEKLSVTFKCGVCNLDFKSSNALKRHSRGHTQGGHSYACHLCPYTSLDKSTLVRHLRTHNGERPFQCAICKYAFTTKANCERHVRKRHKKTSKNEIRNAMQYNPNMSTSNASNLTVQNLSKHNSLPGSAEFPGSSDTVCKYCNADFKYNRVLRHHLRSLHNSCNRKPYSCTLCKLGFSTKNNCVRHVLKQHPECKDRTSSVVIANGSSTPSNSCSEYSESESLNTAENSHKWNQDSSSLSSSSFNFDTQRQTLVAPHKNSSLAALCQIAGQVSSVENGCNNAVSGSDGCDGDESSDNVEELPLDLAKIGEGVKKNDEEQPLDLAVHALDLSLKPKKSIVPETRQDLRKCSEIVRNAATSLLSLHSMVPRPETFLPNSSLIHRNIPLQAHSSSIPIPQRQPSPVTLPPPLVATLPNSNLINDIYRIPALNANKSPLVPKNQRSFTCIYCSAGFTLKSNMERHIKRKHPEFARPPRVRGSTLVTQKDMSVTNVPVSLLSKPNVTTATLSNKTRAALRVVLNNKAIGSSSNVSTGSNGSRASSPVSDHNSNNDVTLGRFEVSGDLASVSELIADTTNSTNTLKQYFDKANENEVKSDTEAEGSSKNEEIVRPQENAKSSPSSLNGDTKLTIVPKKRSAYTDSPNSVSCPYCSRRFPWTSSLRRHILTHTGLKPYKCPKCPILFTTKSNCERHLLRKHGNDSKRLFRSEISSSASLETKQFKCNLCVNSYFINQGNLKKHYYLRHWTKTNKGPSLLKNRSNGEKFESNQNIPEDNEGTNNEPFDLIFRCHICEDESFTERLECLSHLQSIHSKEYEILLSKGAVDKVPTSETKLNLAIKTGEVTGNQNKIYCVFCPRQFTSDENLKRHMRVHLGERPFKCTLCTRKFSLKNSLLRHYRTNHADVAIPMRSKTKRRIAVLAVDDCEKTDGVKQPADTTVFPLGSNSEICETKHTGNDDTNDGGDLIQNLLGIEDSKILDEMLNSADSAARLLGVKEDEIRN